jgi:hypothetical protein
MSQVETLLSVDAGRVPPGTLAFFPRDQGAGARRLFALVALALDGVALSLILRGGGHAPGAALLALIGVALSLGAIPTTPDVAEPVVKRPTLVVTPEGLIVRDAAGLRSWQFEDLVEVRRYNHQMSLGILLIRKDGRSEFVDTQLFHRGDKVRDLIHHRFKPRAA